jgi:hypothetical protein
MSKSSKRAAALYSLVGLIGVLGVGAAIVSVSHSTFPATEPAARAVRILLARAGVTADGLAAAGVNPTQTTAAVGRIIQHFETLSSTLTTTDASFREASAQVSRLERLVRSGRGSGENVTALAAARTQLATTRSARDAAVTAVLQDAEEAIGETPAATLVAIRDNPWGVPVHLRVVPRTTKQWATLREAVRCKDVSTRLGRQTPIAVQGIISAAEEDTAVTTAKYNLQNGREAIASAIASAIGH